MSKLPATKFFLELILDEVLLDDLGFVLPNRSEEKTGTVSCGWLPDSSDDFDLPDCFAKRTICVRIITGEVDCERYKMQQQI